MKIIEILQKEGIGADLKKDAGDAVKGIGRGINAFVQGAGGPDIKGTFDKYAGDTLKGASDDGAGTDKGPRGIGAESGLDEILKSMYGENLPDEVRADWEAAINSGNEDKIKAVNNKYEEKIGILPGAQSTKFPGKLKRSHKSRIYALAGLPDPNL